ncbi:MAG: DUF4912 domain-containing protein [Candidatus Xiphinematobacter sp.]|nr:MAG: DUF4912 domain-containing protein [Candidatus Xiphinematobacter sp.]
MSASDNSDVQSLSVELPNFYGSNAIFSIAQSMHCLFTYWDIDTDQCWNGPLFVRCIAEGGGVESEIRVKSGMRSCHIPVLRIGAIYFIELGYYVKNQWSIVVRSSATQLPSNQPSSSNSFDYATLPLCLSFRQLLICIQGAVLSGEGPVKTLARLQREGLFQLSNVGHALLSENERTILEAVLGRDVLNLLFSLSCPRTDAIELRLRARQCLEQHLNVLSTRETPPEWGTKESGLFAALIALLSTDIPLWSSSTPLTNWLRASIGRRGFDEPLASWDASPASSWDDIPAEEEGGEFFLHVDAEVVFYGTTQPNSSVMIDSNPVKTNPDGSFLFRFVFPEGAYEVPIVATSPDGLETRSAVLRFHRSQPPSIEKSGGTLSSVSSSPPCYRDQEEGEMRDRQSRLW